MAVLHLLAQRHGKFQPEAAHEILLLVTVVDDGVHKPHLLTPRVKVEAHDERQPFARAGRRPVHALDLQHRPHRAFLLDRHPRRSPEELIPRRRFLGLTLRAPLHHTNEPAAARHFPPAHRDRFDQVSSPVCHPQAHHPRVDLHPGVTPPHAHDRPGRSLTGTGRQSERARLSRPANRRESDPLQRPVGPVGQRPALHGKHLSRGSA